jgi:hypothetical protein
VGLRLRLGHHLDEERPAWEIGVIDRGQQVAAMAFAIFGNDSCSLGVGEVLDPLLRAEMEFDPDALIGLVVTCLPKVTLRKARYFNGL